MKGKLRFSQIQTLNFPNSGSEFPKFSRQFISKNGLVHLLKWTGSFTKMDWFIYQNGRVHLPKWTGSFAKMDGFIYQNGLVHLLKLTGSFARMDEFICRDLRKCLQEPPEIFAGTSGNPTKNEKDEPYNRFTKPLQLVPEPLAV